MKNIPDNISILSSVSESELKEAIRDFLNDEPEWIDYAIRQDPALTTKSRERAEMEVFLYQGLHAIALHRKANKLYLAGDTFRARQLSQAARLLTVGIEIHPGATIGKNFFIDH